MAKGILCGKIFGKLLDTTKVGIVPLLNQYFASFFNESPVFEDGLLVDNTGNGHNFTADRANCYQSTNTRVITLDSALVSGNKWYIEFDISEVNTSQIFNLLAGGNAGFGSLALRNNTTNVFVFCDDAGTTFTGTDDTSALTNGKLLVYLTGAEVVIYYNDVLFDTITASTVLTIWRLANYNSFSFGRGLDGKLSGVKAGDLSAYNTANINKALVDTLLENPQHYLPLNEFDSDETLPSTFTFNSVTSSITGTITNGLAANIGKATRVSYNTLYGFARVTGSEIRYPKNLNGIGYAGLVGDGDEEVLPLSDKSEQYYLAKSGDTEWIAKDLAAGEILYASGVPQSTSGADLITIADYMTVTKDGDVFTKITINK